MSIHRNIPAPCDFILKFLLIGDSGVGKSCMLLRYVDETFASSFITTIGIDFKIKTIDLEGFRVKMQIWDTAGQERFRTITTAYYRGAMAIAIVYDVTDRKSFENVRGWLNNMAQHSNEGVACIIVGNKCEALAQREVLTSEGEAQAAKYGHSFMETSAKDDINIEAMFLYLARACIADRIAETQREQMIILEEAKATKANCNC